MTLTEQVVQFGFDVDMVALLAVRHDPVRPAEEVRDLPGRRLEMRLAER
jgi:hypothetical protein